MKIKSNKIKPQMRDDTDMFLLDINIQLEIRTRFAKILPILDRIYKILALVVLLALIFGLASAAKSEESPKYAQITIKSNGKTWHYEAEVASTREQRKKGLSLRDEASPMLFDFGYAKTPESVPPRVCMWMKDTRIPLRAIFIGISEKVPAAGGAKEKKAAKIAKPGASPSPAAKIAKPGASPAKVIAPAAKIAKPGASPSPAAKIAKPGASPAKIAKPGASPEKIAKPGASPTPTAGLPKTLKIISIARMLPHSRELHCAEGAAYVLELPDSEEKLPEGAKVEVSN